MIDLSKIEKNFFILYFLNNFERVFRSESGITFTQSLSSIFKIVSFIEYLLGIYFDLPDAHIVFKTISHGFELNEPIWS